MQGRHLNKTYIHLVTPLNGTGCSFWGGVTPLPGLLMRHTVNGSQTATNVVALHAPVNDSLTVREEEGEDGEVGGMKGD